MRWCGSGIAFGAAAIMLILLTPAIADPIYVAVDGAPSPPVTKTYLYGTNARGDAAGYFELSGRFHGFTRKSDGTIVMVKGSAETFLFDINKSGASTGNETVKNGFATKGIVAKSNGKPTAFFILDGKFDAEPVAINDNGDTTGAYLSKEFVYRGFVRSADGADIGFDAPGAGTDSNKGQGTFPTAINAAGVVAGVLSDSSSVHHCFMRDASGVLMTIDITGESNGSSCSGLNEDGTIAGNYRDGTGSHGFLRTAGGSISMFSAPGAGTGSGQGTFAKAINKKGTVAGYIIDSTGAAHGFLRSAAGKFTVFDMPDLGGVAVTATFPQDINDKDEVAGYFTDASSVTHGFLRLP